MITEDKLQRIEHEATIGAAGQDDYSVILELIAEVRRLSTALETEQRLSGERLHMLTIARTMLKASGKGDLFELELARSIRTD